MSKPPHNQRGQHPQQVQQQVQQVQVQQWSGPLPAPADLEKFNQVIPDGAQRIFAMAEKEQIHRIDFEKFGLAASIKEHRRGQYLGAAISISAVIGAAITAIMGVHWTVSVALVGVPVLGLVRAIVKPRQ